MAVVTVTPNPALDLTYTVGELRPGHAHRVTSVRRRPGGKGINVARVLHTLGVPATVTGLVGGPEGASLRTGLAELAIDDTLVTADLLTRRTVNIVDESAGTATLFNEPGPEVSGEQWARLRQRVVELAVDADAVTICGSMPPGVAPSALTDLVGQISRTGTTVIVDTSGPALRAAAHARPTILKPNADELHDVTGIPDARRAAAALQEETGAAVVASLGDAGLLAVTDDGTWTARLPQPLTGNPTGAGDSVVAALAAGVRAGLAWPEMLRRACALSAATVLAAAAGEYDAAAYARLRETVLLGGTT
ncbi:1-phosphofructokinase family hexose kinase [Phytoactinopolyspora endophytica]|uniref:1-phosphofructokinase family hexose kinase n=1 Tax=Phytoactinopolyspora endophytica TaxID=1642495 RepID=UPI00101B616A|nr:1-phosphofructokinase family hexose kinase [Phytoactinopolyspora endophytica]